MAVPESRQAWQRFQSDVRSFADAVGAASRDAGVRDGARSAARSLGSALGETLREVGGEIEKAFRRTPPK
ncbi:MAG TPA: hypothetical protein VGG31_03040 [Candidatus Dormibacteraeota bacterium]|jgi:hypothetical protein